ncbi:hypothetical protein ES703_34225 [subsurface metagenome]
MAMKREELDELDVIIRDLRMAMDIQEQIDAGTTRGLIDFADGEKISVPIPEEAKSQLAEKIAELSSRLKAKATVLK